MWAQLFNACKLGKIEILEVFLSQGLNINYKNSKGSTLLHEAARCNNAEVVKCLIKNGVDISLKNNKGETAFDLSFKFNTCWSKQGSVLKMLVRAGADINTTSEYGQKPLHLAATEHDTEFVQLLLNRGADINVKDNHYWTPLHCALFTVVEKKVDTSTIELLLSSKPDINAKCLSPLNYTPLHFLFRLQCQVDSPIPTICKLIGFFKKHGADFYSTAGYNDDISPVNLACKYPKPQILKALIINGIIDANYDCIKGSTLLHFACLHKDLSLIKLLLKNGANINKLDNLNRSVLYYAIKPTFSHNTDAKRIISINYLLKWNPDFNMISDYHGLNILTTSIWSNIRMKPLYQMIIRHLAQLDASQVHPSLIETISSVSEVKNYFGRCNMELRNARNSRIHPDSWVTHYKLLFNDKTKLIKYAGNQDLFKDFTEDKVVEKFPIYGDLMYERFVKAANKRLNMDQTSEILCEILPVKNLDSKHPIILKIVSFLNSKDRQNLHDVLTS